MKTLVAILILSASFVIGEQLYSITCPNPKCGKEIVVKPASSTTTMKSVEVSSSTANKEAETARQITTTIKFQCPSCKATFSAVDKKTAPVTKAVRITPDKSSVKETNP